MAQEVETETQTETAASKIIIKITKYSGIVRQLTRNEYELLKNSIARHGFTPFIIINPDGDVLDGHHRFRACQELGIEPRVHVKRSEDEDEERSFVIDTALAQRHSTEFQRIEIALKKKPDLQKRARMNQSLGGKLKEAFTNIGETSSSTTTTTTNAIDVQEIIAKEANSSKGNVSKGEQIINSKLFQQDADFREDCRSGKASINFAYQAVKKSQFDKPPAIDKAEAWSKALENVTDDLERFARFGKLEYHNEAPMTYNVWNFVKADLRLGLDHPGQIPGQIAMNVLYYYTSLGSLVVDPMAGGGSTIDACKVMGRRCLAYDVKPTRPDIGEWDIYREQALPPQVRSSCYPDLIFLDPPYGFIMRGKYSEKSLSSLSTEEFLKAMEVIARVCYDNLKGDRKKGDEKDGGGGGSHVALIIQGISDERQKYFIDLPFRCTSIFEKAGFRQRQRISVPVSTQSKSALDVARFQKMKEQLNINRDLIIFVK
jgi:DNA modification methylase